MSNLMFNALKLV